MGGVGALLLFVGVLPFLSTFFILPLIGIILLLIGMKGCADYYREGGIFNNALYSVITLIVGGVVFVAVAFIALMDFFTAIGMPMGGATVADWSNWSTRIAQVDWTNVGMSVIGGFIGYIFLALVILFVFVVVSAVLMRKSLGLLKEKSGVGLFSSTGIVLLVGAVLTIIVFGIILIWISMLLLAIAFFQMKPQPPQTATPTQV